MDSIDILRYNAGAWDREVERDNPWTRPVSPEIVAAARAGRWEIILTPTRALPRSWFPDLSDCDVLCLASGGGQQGPILAAAGARVTVFDNSERQLGQDRMVAAREGLQLSTVRGDMADLGGFADRSFDLIVHPCSNCFVPNVRPVWAEAFRVLRDGGQLLAGFSSAVVYLFDAGKADRGELEIRHALPYSDLTSLSETELERLIHRQEPLEFGHTLTDQIGGQLDAGFAVTGLYEDYSPGEPLADYTPTFVVTRALKPSTPEAVEQHGE